MAVETRYVVIRTDRSNKEQEVMTFTDKKAADEYDKMLDMADAMFELLHQANTELSEQQCEELSIYLAKQREEVLLALQAKKKVSPASKRTKKSASESQADLLEESEPKQATSSLAQSLMAEEQPTPSTSGDNKLVDFVIEKDDAA